MENSVLGLDGFSDPVQVGHGGYGVVYRAVQDDLHRSVAVKVLSGGVDGASRRRFERERLAMGALSGHPAIVTVHESGFNAAGRPYLVMEYMAGGSLADRLGADGPLSWPEAVAIGARIAMGLEAAHAAGLLHRDVKPENLLVSDFGEVKLSDFGIASLTEGSLSATHTVTASVAHAGPEVLEGKRPSVASDVYSLGSSVFALISGRAAFRHETDESVVPMLTRVLTAPVPDLRPLGVPDSVAAVLERSMAKEPEARYQSARELREALEAAARSEGVSLPVLAGAAAAAGATTVVEPFPIPPTMVDHPAATVQEGPGAATVHEDLGAATVQQGPSDATVHVDADETTRVEQPAASGVNSRDLTVAGGVSPFATPRQPLPPVSSGGSSRRRSLVVAAVVALVLLIGGGVAAAVVLGGGGDDSDTVQAGGPVGGRRESAKDTEAPTITLDTQGAIVPNGNPKVEVYGKANEPATITCSNGGTAATDPNRAWRVDITFPGPGDHEYSCVAVDAADNQSAAVKIKFTYLPPTTTTTRGSSRGGGSSSGGGGKSGSTAAPPANPPAVSPPNNSQTSTAPPPPPPPDPNAQLEAYKNACANSGWSACDSLYSQSDVGSAYEEYGATCGHATNGGVSVGNANGRCAELVALQGQCYYGQWSSCDSLYNQAPSGGFKIFGDTCGYRIEESSGYYCTQWAAWGYL